MRALKETLLRIHDDESGATTTEYVILISILAVGLIAALKAFGGKIRDAFKGNADAISDNAGNEGLVGGF